MTYGPSSQEVPMRARLLGFTVALVLTALGLIGPAAQAAAPLPRVDEKTCTEGHGTVEYDSATGLWTCIDGKYDGEPID